jgi:acyl-CoA oxidase
MITLRVAVVNHEGWNLARALTIAVRYGNVRRQFGVSKSGPEMQVISYSSVKFRLFPLLGVAFAYIFAAKGLAMGYMEMMSELRSEGESGRLAEIHALSSGLKACSTWDCLAGIEECRKACGGHGFSAYAGIGHIWANGVASQTYEGAFPATNLELKAGDNYVISQQTARACLKYLSEGRDLPPNAEYLSRRQEANVQLETAEDWKRPEVQLQVLESRARLAITRLAKLVQKGTPWTDLNMDCVAASRAHIELFLLRTFTNIVATVDAALHPILLKLKDLVLPLRHRS